MEKLSAFVTTFNNARTLASCLESVKWADEIVLLDSGSTDATLDIARRYGCVIHHHAFLGYGAQKQLALTKISNQWGLLLDADEALSPALQQEIRALMQRGFDADGYAMPRQEQLFWRMCDPHVRMNYFLRLFDKNKAHVTDMPIHAAPMVNGRIRRLHVPFYHFGETDIHTKVDKINSYSSGLVQDKVAKGTSGNPLIMLFYPPLFFFKQFIFKRNFLNGWAGFITSVVGAFYVFLKYAKLYEYHSIRKHGVKLPAGAPPLPDKPGSGV